MDQLSEDIIVNIFSNLQAKIVLELRCICKQWRRIINGSCFGPQLAEKHLKKGIEDPILLHHSNKPSESHDNPNNNSPYIEWEDWKDGNNSDQQSVLEINLKLFPWPSSSTAKPSNKDKFLYESSASGILCFTRKTSQDDHCSKTSKPYLVNPLRKEVLELPPLNLEPLNSSQKRYLSYGFGFDKSLRKCKVVCFVLDVSGDIVDSMIYYTLNQQKESSSSKWIQLTKSQPKCVPFPSPICIDGVVYWSCCYDNTYMIMAFHLEKEEFRLVSLPLKLEDYSPAIFELIDLNRGVLGFADLSSTNHIEIWNLNEKENWIKMYRCEVRPPYLWPNRFHPYRVLGPWKNGELLLRFLDQSIMTYNPNTNTFKYFSVPLLQEDENTRYYSYSPSLLSLSWFQDQLLE
ncbi:putative F-box protein At1g12855 [Humulus lupulus]|uniref:putative F-box protein At1g12855 n=1 Tax=Humulus lupulus TaxID=3486 RepID=UPI002B410E3E|nr:putative F-box protein At1g12855 [Humulus lupulus]